MAHALRPLQAPGQIRTTYSKGGDYSFQIKSYTDKRIEVSFDMSVLAEESNTSLLLMNAHKRRLKIIFITENNPAP